VAFGIVLVQGLLYLCSLIELRVVLVVFLLTSAAFLLLLENYLSQGSSGLVLEIWQVGAGGRQPKDPGFGPEWRE
jgi:hypothetical protein